MSALEELAVHADPDGIVILRGATWADFQRMQEMRGDCSAPRFTYVEGSLEIMSPSRTHESIKSMIGRLVEVYCLEHDIDFDTLGSWTIEDKQHDRGAEPDECYVFSGAAEPQRPDLAIEIVWTSGRLDKLRVYQKLGVREVWYWRKGVLQPYVLRGESYRAVAKSKALPGLDLAQLASFVDQPTTGQAIRAYRAALRGAAKRSARR